jgi:uncharacterized protein YciI
MKSRALLCALIVLAAALPAYCAQPDAPKPKQFLGILRLVARLQTDSAWTKEDEAAVSRHFQRLKEEAKKRKVILAGRTLERGDTSMGLVIFEADNLEEAKQFMTSDPAVLAGVMTTEVRPYFVAVQRE